ncbi:ATPase domain-containing protein [Haloarculaceae archaeon H-GB11]|nr:ATPase domain-containing protein [Haloarculaceae archaeon H-GB11]
MKEQECTVLFTSQDTPTTPDDDLQFMSDGIITLDADGPRRTIEVSKFRGSNFDGGRHGVRITDDGMHVFPKLSPGTTVSAEISDPISAGVPELDDLLKGGLDPGTVTILSGPSGVGKTTIGTQFATEFASNGMSSAIYLFEESERTFRHRSRSIGIPVEECLDEGSIRLHETHPGQMSTEEFAGHVRQQVEDRDVEYVMIDGIDGYRHTLLGDDDHVPQLHQLGSYLRNEDVTTLLTAEVSRITGEFEATDQDVSYLADNLLFLRYLEYRGEMRKAIGVLKKRASDFERTLREFEITDDGVTVGEPLTDLRGILEGTPDWSDEADS